MFAIEIITTIITAIIAVYSTFFTLYSEEGLNLKGKISLSLLFLCCCLNVISQYHQHSEKKLQAHTEALRLRFDDSINRERFMYSLDKFENINNRISLYYLKDSSNNERLQNRFTSQSETLGSITKDLVTISKPIEPFKVHVCSELKINKNHLGDSYIKQLIQQLKNTDIGGFITLPLNLSTDDLARNSIIGKHIKNLELTFYLKSKKQYETSFEETYISDYILKFNFRNTNVIFIKRKDDSTIYLSLTSDQYISEKYEEDIKNREDILNSYMRVQYHVNDTSHIRRQENMKFIDINYLGLQFGANKETSTQWLVLNKKSLDISRMYKCRFKYCILTDDSRLYNMNKIKSPKIRNYFSDWSLIFHNELNKQ